jgi:hypothetical protein
MTRDLHLEQQIVALVQVLLRHTDPHRKSSTRVQSVALHPRIWDIVTAFVHDVLDGDRDCDCLSSKGTQEAETEEIHGGGLSSLVRGVQHQGRKRYSLSKDRGELMLI